MEEHVKHAEKPKHDDHLLMMYYTDPLCVWSWCFQNTLDQLINDLGNKLNVRYVMSELISDWPSYQAKHNVTDMAYHFSTEWNHAASETGMTVSSRIWLTDPPLSSSLSCIAVKTAALQSKEAEQLLLFKLREAAMIRGLNISDEKMLLQLAAELAIEHSDKFRIMKFAKDWSGGKGLPAFRRDLYFCHHYQIEQLPVLYISAPEGGKVLIKGYRPYDFIRNKLHAIGVLT